jgi:hypothetical protein
MATKSPQSSPSTKPRLSDKAPSRRDIYNPTHQYGPLFQTPTKKCKSHPKAKKHHLKLLGPVQNDPTTTPARETSPLLRLPIEVRHLIFSYALTSPSSSLTYNAADMRFSLCDIGSGLLSSCHALALETQYLHLKLNTLIFVLDRDTGVSERDLKAILTNLERLGDARGWRIHVKIQWRAGDGSWTLWCGQVVKLL